MSTSELPAPLHSLMGQNFIHLWRASGVFDSKRAMIFYYSFVDPDRENVLSTTFTVIEIPTIQSK